MNLRMISKIDTKDKKHLLNEICIMYRRLKKSHLMIDTDRLTLADSVQPSNKLFNKKSISIFNTILELLPEDQKEIINNDFIYKKNPFWYEDQYSKATYYRIKNDAMNNFLYLFYR